jgi:hypothetical protein
MFRMTVQDEKPVFYPRTVFPEEESEPAAAPGALAA